MEYNIFRRNGSFVVENMGRNTASTVVNNAVDKFVKQSGYWSRLHRGGLLAAGTTKREATMRMRLIFGNIAASCLVFRRVEQTRGKRGTKTLENETKGDPLRVQGDWDCDESLWNSKLDDGTGISRWWTQKALNTAAENRFEKCPQMRE